MNVIYIYMSRLFTDKCYNRNDNAKNTWKHGFAVVWPCESVNNASLVLLSDFNGVISDLLHFSCGTLEMECASRHSLDMNLISMPSQSV